MIRLFAQENEIVLPDDFQFTFIENNPEITTDGELSLEINVSLLHPMNQIALKFINRLNISGINKSIDGKLIDDFRTIYGTLVVQNNTDSAVSLQFLSGNSELNYISSNSSKIYNLNWGEETSIDKSRAIQSLSYPCYGTYAQYHGQPDYKNNFVCPPVQLGDIIANDYSLDMLSPVETIIMQPYLMYYIEKLPALLGYTLKENILKNDVRANKIYLVNAVNSLKYADALPDWTISEFISEVEKMFNVSFVVDSSDRSLSIVRLNSNINSKKKIDLNGIVVNSFKRDLSAESLSTRFDHTRVEYDVPSTDYFKYQRLADDILAKCKIIEFKNSFIPNPSAENKLIIYRDTESANDFFIRHQYFDGTHEPIVPLYSFSQDTTTTCLINKFRSSGDSTDKIMTLKITPVSIALCSKDVTINQAVIKCNFPIPSSSNSYIIPEEQGMMELIENGEQGISRLSIMEICLYTGYVQIYSGVNYVSNFPVSHTDTTPDFYFSPNFSTIATKTLRLVGSGNIPDDYDFKNYLNTSEEYTFEIIDSAEIKPCNLYVYRNSVYMPIRFERKKTNKQSKTVIGKFYRFL